MSLGKVYLIPTVLQSDEKALQAIPNYILEAIKMCSVFFTENEKNTRRFYKRLWKEMVIDDYEWFAMHKAEPTIIRDFERLLKEGKNIGIISDAGCPGIADPGQLLVEAAQKLNVKIQPLVGPNSILLALMASGMNGQNFQFCGYLPVDSAERKKAIAQLEQDAIKRNCTQIFIETPYRNNGLISDILAVCKPETKFCIAVDITAETETIKTKTIERWRKEKIDFHKRPAIFLLAATYH